MRVAAVDDDVSLLEHRDQTLDYLVDCLTGLYHQHHSPRFFQRLNQFLDRVRSYDLCSSGFLFDEFVYLGDGSIKYSHAVTMVVHVQDQVLAHDSQTDQSDVTTFFLHESSL